MGNVEAEQFENAPEGSPGRIFYEYCHTPFQEWLDKYHSNPNDKNFKLWIVHAKDALYNPSAFLLKWKSFDFDEMKKTMDETTQESSIDHDTKLFIGFLAGDGFFKKYRISVEQWFEIENWQNPQKEPRTERRPIREILKYRNGLNYLKECFAGLDWWKY